MLQNLVTRLLWESLPTKILSSSKLQMLQLKLKVDNCLHVCDLPWFLGFPVRVLGEKKRERERDTT